VRSPFLTNRRGAEDTEVEESDKRMNNNQPISAAASTNPRNDLLLEIEQTPEKYIPELLQIVRLFRQSIVMKQTSTNDWENAMNEINNSDNAKKEQRKTNIKNLFDSWNELDEQQEQQETLEIIESIKGISI
jgi:predicted secreted protein